MFLHTQDLIIHTLGSTHCRAVFSLFTLLNKTLGSVGLMVPAGFILLTGIKRYKPVVKTNIRYIISFSICLSVFLGSVTKDMY